MKISTRFLVFIILCIVPLILYGQEKRYDGPEDPAGDIAAERAGFMNGNRLLMYFVNNTQVAEWPRANASRWPNDYSGTKICDVASVLIGSEVYIYQDSIPITDINEVTLLAELGQIDTLYFIETSSYNAGPASGTEPDMNWNRTVEWGLYPVPGYFNEAQDYPAMSNKPDSWPLGGWPSTGFEKKWPGEWNGRFGRGIKYADLECYYVANDAQDMEYIIQPGDPEQKLITEGPRYYPRPGMYIGDINPNVTIQKGFPWGGLGLRVEVRGFQWNNPETQDMIFWEYNISNISDYTLPSCGFGIFVDPSIGGDTGNDHETASFHKLLDLCYVWEKEGVGEGGKTPGIFGIAYLESPGIPYDGIDNDDDGLVDEKRDNPAGNIIGPTDGIQDIDKFLAFYNYSLDELRDHYEGDEDQDWQDGYDANGNGTYAYLDENGNWQLEPSEWAGDDVGLDGVGPLDLQYDGPDEGECNGMPDWREGVGCEPNFNATDVSEADMLGLTAFNVVDWPTWKEKFWIKHDKSIWKFMDSNTFNDYISASYLFEFFASTRFPLSKGRTSRISMAMLASFEDLVTLNSERKAPRMFKMKQNAQLIYERDYRFAQPPLMPTLKATPGDGKVILIWDDMADKNTREPLLSRINDFEGYKLYRSTDKLFQDTEVITDGQGVKMFKKPIFQCDKIDNITGYADYGFIEGTAFYLGDDTGIRHHFIDEYVINGRTYYYALVAYDYGIEQFGISPTENNVVVELDEAETVIRMGKNVQVVTPRVRAAGYIPPSIKIDESQTSKEIEPGVIVPTVVSNRDVKANHTYCVTFGVDTIATYTGGGRWHHPMDLKYVTSKLFVYDITDDKEKLVYSETKDNYSEDNIVHHKSPEVSDIERYDYHSFKEGEIQTDVFDGISLTINPITIDTAYLDIDNIGWITGNSPIHIDVGFIGYSYYPWEYEIVFTNSYSTYETRNDGKRVTEPNGDKIGSSNLIFDHKYNFYVINKNSVDSTGEYERLDLIVYDKNQNGSYDWQEDVILAGHVVEVNDIIRWAGTVFSIDFMDAPDESQLPKPNDVYRLKFIRPLSQVESFVFTVRPENSVDKTNIKTTMDSIKVVPNPYIATNAMETAVANKYLNQRRRIMFTHLPANCVIRIFTPTGILVDRINVNNESDNGIVHWDLLSKEDLEIAAGMYIYHVKCNVTGKEKIGKFAVIK